MGHPAKRRRLLWIFMALPGPAALCALGSVCLGISAGAPLVDWLPLLIGAGNHPDQVKALAGVRSFGGFEFGFCIRCGNRCEAACAD